MRPCRFSPSILYIQVWQVGKSLKSSDFGCFPRFSFQSLTSIRRTDKKSTGTHVESFKYTPKGSFPPLVTWEIPHTGGNGVWRKQTFRHHQKLVPPHGGATLSVFLRSNRKPPPIGPKCEVGLVSIFLSPQYCVTIPVLIGNAPNHDH